MATVEKWVGLGSAMAGLALLWSKMPEHVHEEVRNFIREWMPMVASYFNPYEQITIYEYSDQKFRRNKLFDAIEAYLSEWCAKRARKFKADLGKDSDLPQPQVTLDDDQLITDNFEGVRIWWNLRARQPAKDRGTVINIRPEKDEPRLYRVVFHKRHRQLMFDRYLRHIVSQERKLTAEKRQMRLFTNKRFEDMWSDVPFEHPATFDHLAMDPTMKKEITDDLNDFQEGKPYYSKVGKAWKRGYLLHGPPGTGKSTMISAMANLLKYDVYDLDLTSVRTNAELRKLFVETTGKSIIVIEDIDAIEVDITTKRKDKKADGEGENHRLEHSDKNDSKVTLSALLSIVDGLWSACGGERIIVFTTNHFERLDPALIRRGRMDMHMEMSYCRFEAFKVLAKNYIGVTDHFLFGQIEQLLKENDMSPADVAHNLMCNKRKRDSDERLEVCEDECMAGLVETLKKAKKDSAATTSTQQQGYANRPRRSARGKKLKA